MENKGIVLGQHAPEKKARAQELRRQMTPTEKRLWQQLRDNRLGGLHFRRQQVIDGFIADFYCYAAGLIVETDGGVHENQKEYDALRDGIIAGRGLQVLRFPNNRIENDLEAVLVEIRQAAQERLSTQAAQQPDCLP